ncbi:hypothetical protein PG994_001273 [Apiospora phragmitis]|uniref:2EXR domain-containing protein n=1 Tax=Apiospora phragmitis TaxID=2905665 RepID=A0ABR1WT22_9PEZI
MECRFRIKFQVYSDGSDDEQQQPSSSFTLFSSLPPELRLKIWDLAASVPRIIMASCTIHAPNAEQPESDPGTTGAQEQQHLRDLTSRRRGRRFVPAVLHVNHEARTRTLERHYALAFSWKVPHVFAYMDGRPNQNRTIHQHNINGSSSSSALGSGGDQTPHWSEPHVYFNFERDALYLLGELEPYDEFGFNSPMTYFLRREDTARVRCVALAFSALKYGETGSQQIFGSLFHVVDRFPLCTIATPELTPTAPGINGGGGSSSSNVQGEVINGSSSSSTTTSKIPDQPEPHVLICVMPGDEWTHALLGGTEPLSQRNRERQQRQSENGGQLARTDSEEHEEEPEEPENVLQKIWTDWYRGSIVRSRMASVRFKLITEDELESIVTGQPSAPIATSSTDGSSRRDDYKELHDALGKYLHGAA